MNNCDRSSWLKRMRDWGTFIFALGSFLFLSYHELIESYDLKVFFNQTVLAPMPKGIKENLAKKMFLFDVLSPANSKQSKMSMDAFPSLKHAVETKNKDIIIKELSEIKKFIYLPSNEVLMKFFGDELFVPLFYIPLVIVNDGSKSVFIDRMYMVIKDKKKKKWMYDCALEIDKTRLMQLNPKNDMENISSVFIGINASPNEKVVFYGYFIPYIKHLDKTKVIKDSPKPGIYELMIYCYDSKSQLIFKSEPKEIELSADMFVNMFNGGVHAYYKTDPEIIQKLLGIKQNYN